MGVGRSMREGRPILMQSQFLGQSCLSWLYVVQTQNNTKVQEVAWWDTEKGLKGCQGRAAILLRELISGVEGNPCFVPCPLVPKALDLTNDVHTLSCTKFHAHFII